MLIPPKRIVFTGGGLRTLGHFGALQALHEKGLLAHVKEFIGVSAGALVGLGCMLGYTVQEMKQVVLEFDFTLLQNAHPELVFEFFSQYGIDSGEVLEKFVRSLLRVKGYSIDLTFAQWATEHSEKPRLRCYASDLNACKPKEFSAEKTPECTFVHALRASMCLPLYFTPVKDLETGHLLVDGGVIHNFPMNLLTESEKETALGISFLYTQDPNQEIEDFPGFLLQLYNCGFNPRTYQVQQDNKLRCILIPTGPLSAYNFDLTKESKEDLIQRGYTATLLYCTTYLQALREQRRPVRRFSVA